VGTKAQIICKSQPLGWCGAVATPGFSLALSCRAGARVRVAVRDLALPLLFADLFYFSSAAALLPARGPGDACDVCSDAQRRPA